MVAIKAILATRSSTLLLPQMQTDSRHYSYPKIQMQTDSLHYSKCPKCKLLQECSLKIESEQLLNIVEVNFWNTFTHTHTHPTQDLGMLKIITTLSLPPPSLLDFMWGVCFPENWRNLQMCQKVSSESKKANLWLISCKMQWRWETQQHWEDSWQII